MLFMVTHTHSPDLCPVDNPVALAQLANPDHAAQAGVKVLSSYNAPPEHTLYIALEAADYAAVVVFLRPLMKIGTPRISPVLPLGESLNVLH